MRHDAKRKEAADELQVKEKNQLTSCQTEESLEDSALGGLITLRPGGRKSLPRQSRVRSRES